MSQDMELVDSIASLQGNTLGDILKQFCLRVKKEKDQIAQNIAVTLASLESEDFLKRLFYFKLVNEFKQSECVLSILNKGDKYGLKQALKCKWYFKQAPDLSVFINDVVPRLSYCTRIKVIKLYAKNLRDGDFIENLFTALHRTYDLKTAFVLLPACSQKFVADKLFTFKTKVPSSVVLDIFRSYPDLAKEYLEYILESISKDKRAFRSIRMDDYDNVLLILASTDPKLFTKLYIKYNNQMPYMRLGRKTSKKIIQYNTDSFIANFDQFTKIIPAHISKSILKIDQIEKLQLTLFPKSLTKFFTVHYHTTFLDVGKKLKREIRSEMMLKNFAKAFGRPFLFEDFTNALNIDVIDRFPEAIRIKWIELQLPKTESVYDKCNLLEYLPTSKSIPIMKELSKNQSELNARVYIFKKIFSCLDFNNDLTSLPSILDYFFTRFRNEQTPMREQLFSSLLENERLLMALSVEEWEKMDNIFNLVKLNNEQTEFQYSILRILKIKLFNFYKRGLSMEPHVKNYLIITKSMFNEYDFDVGKIPPFKKVCYDSFILEFNDLKSKEHDLTNLFKLICEYNKDNKKDKINIPDWMVENLLTFLTNEEYEDRDHYIKQEILSHCKKDENLKNKIFTQIYPSILSNEVILFTLKKDPSKIMKYIDIITKKFMKERLGADEMRIIKQLQLYSSFNLPQKISKLSLYYLKEDVEDCCWAKSNSVIILSLLLPGNEFLKIAESYYPVSFDIVYTDSNRDLYKIQQEIAQSLKLLNNPSLAISVLKKFTGGDYLKYAVGSINSISLQISEDEIIPILKEWMDSRVSVRKHFIRSFVKVSPKEAKCDLLNELFKNEKNSSMRLMLFENSLQLFCNEPCQKTFETFTSIASNLEPSDTSAIDKMYDLQKISDEYVSAYVEMLWTLVSKKEDNVQSNAKNKVINLIDKEVLQLLNEDFCELLLKHIFSLQNLEKVDLISFVTIYILYSTDSENQATRLDRIMAYLKNLVVSHWHEYNLGSYFVFPVRKFVSHLIKDLCQNSNEKDKLYLSPCGALKEFKTQLKAMLPEENFIEESIFIDFSITYQQTTGTYTPQLFYDFIKSCFDMLSGINDAVKLSAVQKMLPFGLLETESKLALSELLLSDPSELCNLLGLAITPAQIKDDGSVKHFKNIIRLIIENPHQNIKIQSNSLLSRLVSTVVV